MFSNASLARRDYVSQIDDTRKSDANTTSANYTLPHTAEFSISPLPLLVISFLLFSPTLHPTSPAH